jgi:hypothetical protein
MRIPEIQRELHEMAERLVVLSAELSRRSPVRRAPPTSQLVTPDVVEDVRRTIRDNPNLTYQAVAQMFNINGGRL